MTSTLNQDPDPGLRKLAELAGLATSWHDAFGGLQQVADENLCVLLAALGFPANSATQRQDSLHRLQADHRCGHDALPLQILDVGESLVMPNPGTRCYRLALESGRQVDEVAVEFEAGLLRLAPIFEPGYHSLMIGGANLFLAVCPSRCPVIDARPDQAGRPWGVAVQVYSVVQACENRLPAWGRAGDFASLSRFVTNAGRQGASAVAISPVHALFSAAPERYSPYSPSSRLFLNTAFAAPSVVLGDEIVSQALQQESVRSPGVGNCGPEDVVSGAGSLIDWQTIVPARLAVLRHLFEQVGTRLPGSLAGSLSSFRHEGGLALEHHARFEALHAFYGRQLGFGCGWQDWPAALQDPFGRAADDFAQAHRADVDFHIFLQWLADRGLAKVQDGGRDSGMPVGLIVDLAIGTDRRGSHAWSRQADMLQGVLAGAPPDLIQPLGQNWNITAFSPYALRRSGYKAFIETLRATLRHAGGIRVDHIMGMARMWLIADGTAASQGAYLHYPIQDMLRLVVLEAWRHQAIVVGENLGTVPSGLNEQLHEKGVMGTSVLWFQQNDRWPDWSMATTTTHDLPTVEGWWAGRDIAWRAKIGELTRESAQRQQASRQVEKAGLLNQIGLNETPAEAPRQEILEYVAAQPSPLTIIPIEDLLGLPEQPNLPAAAPESTALTAPAAVCRHPSWRQTLPVGVDALFADDRVRLSLDSVRRGRARNP